MCRSTVLVAVSVFLTQLHSGQAFPFFHLFRNLQNEAASPLNTVGGIPLHIDPAGVSQSNPIPTVVVQPETPIAGANLAGQFRISSVQSNPIAPVAVQPEAKAEADTANAANVNQPPIATEATNAAKSAIEGPSTRNLDVHSVGDPLLIYKDVQSAMEQTTVSETWNDINRVLSGDIPKETGINDPRNPAYNFDYGFPAKLQTIPENAPLDTRTGFTNVAAGETQKHEPLPQAMAQVWRPQERTRKLSITDNAGNLINTGNSLVGAPLSTVHYLRLKKLNDTYIDFVNHLNKVLDKNKMVYERQLRLLQSLDHPFSVNEVNSPNMKGDDGRPWYMKYFDMGEQAMEWAQEKTEILQRKLELYKEKLQEISNDLQYGDYYEQNKVASANQGNTEGSNQQRQKRSFAKWWGDKFGGFSRYDPYYTYGGMGQAGMSPGGGMPPPQQPSITFGVYGGITTPLGYLVVPNFKNLFSVMFAILMYIIYFL